MNGYANNGVRKHGLIEMQPVPLVVGLVAYPGTVNTYRHYIVTDRITSPLSSQDQYLEKFFYIPGHFTPSCYQLDYPDPAVTGKWIEGEEEELQEVRDAAMKYYQDNELEQAPPADIAQLKKAGSLAFRSRTDAGLPEQGMVYCNFNDHRKMSPDIWNVWMNILTLVPGSVFWVLARNEESTRALKAYFTKAGFNSDRLIIAIMFDNPYSHQWRLTKCDVWLDNPQFGAISGGMDSTWAGVPLLTIGNQRGMSGRAQESIVNAVGLGELVRSSVADYIEYAVELGLNPAKLKQLRLKLWKQRYHSKLFDITNWMRHYQQGLMNIWQLFLAGKGPQHIDAAAKWTGRVPALLVPDAYETEHVTDPAFVLFDLNPEEGGFTDEAWQTKYGRVAAEDAMTEEVEFDQGEAFGSVHSKGMGGERKRGSRAKKRSNDRSSNQRKDSQKVTNAPVKRKRRKLTEELL